LGDLGERLGLVLLLFLRGDARALAARSLGRRMVAAALHDREGHAADDHDRGRRNRDDHPGVAALLALTAAGAGPAGALAGSLGAGHLPEEVGLAAGGSAAATAAGPDRRRPVLLVHLRGAPILPRG